MNANRDILFLLDAGFAENGERWFCPHCAQVTGFLAYFPEARSTLDIRTVPFEKPRQEIIALIDDDLQSCPVLVLSNESVVPEKLREDVITSKGRRVIISTRSILEYLALTRALPRPH